MKTNFSLRFAGNRHFLPFSIGFALFDSMGRMRPTIGFTFGGLDRDGVARSDFHARVLSLIPLRIFRGGVSLAGTVTAA